MSTTVEHAAALREEAREHKRSEREHRRKARLKMEELRLFCETHNLTLIIEDRDQEVIVRHARDRRS